MKHYFFKIKSTEESFAIRPETRMSDFMPTDDDEDLTACEETQTRHRGGREGERRGTASSSPDCCSQKEAETLHYSD